MRWTGKALWIGLFGICVVAASGVVGYGVYRRASAQVEEHVAQVEQRRTVREAPVVDVAPAPLPRGRPLIERPGADPFGYPRSYVDGVALRSLLEHRKYAELTRAIEELQDEFEGDPKKELWPIAAAAAFSTSIPRLAPLFDDWVKATPDSFAPYLARGTYRSAVTWAQRGTKTITETHVLDLRAMHDTARAALPDLDRALALRPKLLAALRGKLSPLQLTGAHRELEEVLAAANALCPSCMYVRARYLAATTPRWGGSYDRMRASIANVPVAQNGALRLLSGYIDADRARVALLNKDHDAALAAIERACALGPHSYFLAARADILSAKGDLDQALRDYTAALDLRPDIAALRIDRAGVLADQGKWLDAAADLLAGLRIDTSSQRGRRLLPRIFKALEELADAAAARGERDEALRIYDLAQALYPFARSVNHKRSIVVRAGLTGAPDELPRLEQAVREAPDDFDAHLRLDYALAQRQDFERVVALWTEFLTRNPDVSAAYYERGGAQQRLGRRERATADFISACERGHHAACAIAGRYGGR